MESQRVPPLSAAAMREIWTSTKRLARIIWAERRWLACAILAILLLLSVLPFLLSGIQALLVNDLVASLQTHAVRRTLFVWLAALVATGLLSPVANNFQFFFLKKFWFFWEEKVFLLVLRKKAEIDVAVHENPAYNNLFSQVRESGTYRLQNFSDRQFFIFQNVLEVAAAGAILLFAGPFVLLALVLGNIPDLVVAVRYGREIWGIYGAHAEVRRRFWDLQNHFDELPNLIELKLFQNAGYFISLVRDILVRFHAEQLAAERKKISAQTVSAFVSQGVAAAVIVWLAFRVVGGRVQVGTFLFFLASIAQLRQSLSGLFSNLGRQYEDSLFIKHVFELLDLRPTLPRPRKGAVLPQRTPEIAFRNVTFRYPGAERPALRDFSLVIPPGEKIAFVGANGAGKTTLVKLLCRFYDPDRGTITVGGRDLREIDLDSWYRLLGALFQDYSNYYFLVKDAIELGRHGAWDSRSKIRSAARSSEASAFIERWEKQYEQMLGSKFTGGVEPSIGQWQKLALARTFYRDANVLVLDEPTSSIDAEGEEKIFGELETLPADRTVILISHRFSTVRRAHRICVIEDGRLAELGTHEELLRRRGLYRRLFALQAKGYR